MLLVVPVLEEAVPKHPVFPALPPPPTCTLKLLPASMRNFPRTLEPALPSVPGAIASPPPPPPPPIIS